MRWYSGLVNMQGVQYVPTLGHNLLSAGQLMKGGFSILFDGNACVIVDKKIQADHG